jgi:hypothetical protein
MGNSPLNVPIKSSKPRWCLSVITYGHRWEMVRVEQMNVNEEIMAVAKIKNFLCLTIKKNFIISVLKGKIRCLSHPIRPNS